VREVFATAAEWLAEDRNFALATLVELREAQTAPIGTTIAVEGGGRIVGNIGAGCYETQIVEACMQTAVDGKTRRIDINLTVEDEVVGGEGCGAVMVVVAWRPGPQFRADALEIAVGERAAPLHFGYDGAGGAPVEFEHIFPPKETLVIVGATALAAELAAMARRADFKVLVVDPRPAFSTPERVPDADAIVREWPDTFLPQALTNKTSIVMLSHDPKFDLPALRCALRSEAAYIGLLGSRRSQAARRASLRDDGFDEEGLARIHGPAGLDIGGATTAETALSILAEIVASRHEREGAPLTATVRAIHRRSAVSS
jgi:xanthine dehydrogenase accessory factor